jgi:hypothetical protein
MPKPRPSSGVPRKTIHIIDFVDLVREEQPPKSALRPLSKIATRKKVLDRLRADRALFADHPYFPAT